MNGILLQDWTSIRADGVTTTVVQSEDGWLDADDYGDLVFWVEVAHVLKGGADNVILAYQTAPTKEEGYFSVMSNFAIMASPLPFVVSVLDKLASVPPSRWVRWRLSVVGTPTSTWGATFRIHVACNRRRAG